MSFKTWNSTSTEIRFNKHVYFKINNKWWEVDEVNEIFFTGTRNIETKSPNIIKEVNMEEIEKRYLRLEKYKRLNEIESRNN